MTTFLLFLFLCWGSFLNMLGYRLVHDRNIWQLRSTCSQCDSLIAWYDNIPVLSWILLRGTCRTCKKAISSLYPFIEILTPIILYTIYVSVEHQYIWSYLLFASALIVTIRSDLETMLISRFVSLYAIPIGWMLSYTGLLPISVAESILGGLFGYGLFWLIATIFELITGKQGLGQGDIDLLAFIGSFTGIIGAWAAMLIGSIIGAFCGLIFIVAKKNNLDTHIPFGPFLALGAFCYMLWQNQIILCLIRMQQ